MPKDINLSLATTQPNTWMDVDRIGHSIDACYVLVYSRRTSTSCSVNYNYVADFVPSASIISYGILFFSCAAMV